MTASDGAARVRRPARTGWPRDGRLLAAGAIVALLLAGCGSGKPRARSGAAPSAPATTAYEPWLGLDGNSVPGLGPTSTFVSHAIVYDRSGPIEWVAGERVRTHGRLTRAGRALAFSLAAGMRPVITIEYAQYDGRYESDPSFPNTQPGLTEYVRGFVTTAREIRANFPGAPIWFEPMNEPWGYTTPQYNGAQYAAVIAALLPAAAAAGIPSDDIFVAATGRDWVPQMYEAQPQLETEIAGWYLHPYGPPSGSRNEGTEGIQSLPAIRAQMRSGQSNLIVSEVGYCALDVNEGSGCQAPYATRSASAAAHMLTAMLNNALAYHEEGWLRALLVYSRNAGGWAMQLPGGRLTAAGRALIAFAEAHRQ